MVKECFIETKNVTRSRLHLIFLKACERPPARTIRDMVINPGMPLSDTDMHTLELLLKEEERKEKASRYAKKKHDELDPHGFLETLVRIAHYKYPHIHRLHLQVKSLFEECLLPYASRTDTETFRNLLQDTECQMVFQRYRAQLEKIYFYYADQDGEDISIGASKVINCNELFRLIGDCKLLDSNLTDMALRTVFANAQQDDLEDRTGLEEMDYDEFLEAVSAMAAYKVVNPYEPFGTRLERFIKKMLLPKAKGLAKRDQAFRRLAKGFAGGKSKKKKAVSTLDVHALANAAAGFQDDGSGLYSQGGGHSSSSSRGRMGLGNFHRAASMPPGQLMGGAGAGRQSQSFYGQPAAGGGRTAGGGASPLDQWGGAGRHSMSPMGMMQRGGSGGGMRGGSGGGMRGGSGGGMRGGSGGGMRGGSGGGMRGGSRQGSAGSGSSGSRGGSRGMRNMRAMSGLLL